MFKRLSNHVSPYTHDVVTTLVKKQATDKMNANNAFLIAKKILADLPLVPTGGLTYNLAQSIQFGLLDEICPIEEVDKHWQECLDVASRYLHEIKIWETL